MLGYSPRFVLPSHLLSQIRGGPSSLPFPHVRSPAKCAVGAGLRPSAPIGREILSGGLAEWRVGSGPRQQNARFCKLCIITFQRRVLVAAELYPCASKKGAYRKYPWLERESILASVQRLSMRRPMAWIPFSSQHLRDSANPGERICKRKSHQSLFHLRHLVVLRFNPRKKKQTTKLNKRTQHWCLYKRNPNTRDE